MMPQKTDLYTIMLSYANKHHSPVINIDHFVEFLEKFAKRNVSDRPEWAKWVVGANVKVWTEVKDLVNSGKCKFETGINTPSRVVILNFYSEVLKQVYENIDSNAEFPFPNEKSLGLTIPKEQLRSMAVADLEDYMKLPQKTEMPVLQIKFPDNCGNALVLAPHLPMRILEVSILKVRNYMRAHNNKEYYLSRLNSKLPDKGPILKDFMNQIEIRPMECISHIEAAEEFVCLFWPYFGAQLKTELELENKNELPGTDMAALQAIYFIEFFVGYYRTIANQEKAKELALAEVAAGLSAPPHYFTMTDMLGFTDSQGKLLADHYEKDDLKEFLQDKTSLSAAAGAENVLPELLMFHNNNGEQIFIYKDRVYPVVSKLVEDARIWVRQNVSTRWFEMLRGYQTEPAMEYDRDFERLLDHASAQMVPLLMCFMKDRKLYLVQTEIELSLMGFKESVRIYDTSGKPFPLSTLLLINRKELLTATKLRLPFWYTIPFFFSIMAFFKKLGKKKPAKKPKPAAQAGTSPSGETVSAEQALHDAAQKYLNEHISEGHTIESHLAEMEGRWRKILSEEDRGQMVRDIRGTIKTKMRKMIEFWGVRQINANIIGDIAGNIIQETPPIQDLDTGDAVHAYVSLYLSFLLKNPKK
ncbi:hypothetical protein FACS189473_1880 [Spirochaetia bacterium]|nr:hypothetical protein FACS189473_1880 [Spirochaetia bacterium]